MSLFVVMFVASVWKATSRATRRSLEMTAFVDVPFGDVGRLLVELASR